MIDITKEQFQKFLKLRNSGIINMTNITKGAKLIKESEEIYEEIMFNFTTLNNKF